MSLFRLITRPVKNLTDAIFMPFKAIFVVGLCAFINAMTYNGHWWFKWVAFGMGIAVIVAFARAAKTLLLFGLIGYGGWWLNKRYGGDARRQFDDWVQRTQPQAQQVVDVLRGGPATAR